MQGLVPPPLLASLLLLVAGSHFYCQGYIAQGAIFNQNPETLKISTALPLPSLVGSLQASDLSPNTMGGVGSRF